MPYSAEEISRHLRLGEDSAWEFKQIEFNGDRPVSPKRDDLADEMGAFANAAGGVLLCGVSDAGDVQDMTRGQLDNLERLLVELGQDSIAPRINITTFRQEIDGKAVLLADIPQGYAAHSVGGRTFQRVGSSKRRLDNDETLRLAQRRGQARFIWYDEQPVPNTGFASLDESLWRPLLSATGRADPEIGLTRMHLLAVDEHNVLRATVAGLLICSSAPEQWLPNAYVTATRYRGTDRTSGQADTLDIYGPVQEQIRQAMAFVMRNMQVSALKKPMRENLAQYSEMALFEAIVNAVVHRDYSIRGSRIRIAMFNDRIEINSPGGLPNGITVDSMANLQATRNEVLTSILGRIPVGGIAGAGARAYIMERRGDGVNIILRETQELSGQPSVFELINNAELRVAIPAASLYRTPVTAAIYVHSNGHPVSGADLLALFPDKTWLSATTNANGDARLELHSSELPVVVFTAAAGYRADIRRDWLPKAGTFAIELEPLPNGGAIIIAEGNGRIPGLKGLVKPIRDDYDRTCLYTVDITIDGGKPQPVHFTPGEELILTDANGNCASVRIIDTIGGSSLVEYSLIPNAQQKK